MKKSLLIFSIVIIGLLVASTSAFGFGNPGEGFGAGQYETCVMDSLSEEEQAQFTDIIAEFQEAMSELKEKMRELREERNYEAFLDVKNERRELMEDKQEALNQIVPEEFKNRFENKGHQGRHHGWEKGTSGFNKQERSQQDQ